MSNMIIKKVSFDFDCTLSEPHIQLYAEELVSNGFEIWIVTARYDKQHVIENWHTTEESAEKANQDLFEVANRLGIPNERIIFMNMDDKWNFFKDKDFVWHLDDDWRENKMILKHTKTKAINSWGNSSWKQKCERILNKNKIVNESKVCK